MIFHASHYSAGIASWQPFFVRCFLIEFLGKNEKAETREKQERSETFRNSENKFETRIVEDWPIIYRSSTTILISEYFRPKHADRITEYVDNSSKYDISFDILNNRRIVSLIKRISCLHTRDSKELISTLEQETVGFGRDIAHPRFIAELLRLGDALDLDAGRFSIDFTFLHGRRPEYSELHYKLHNAVTDFLIKPEKVCYRADCPDRDTYRLVCQLTRYLEEEFRFCASNWPKIVPDNFPGPVPQFVLSSEDVKIKGKSDDMGLTGLCFTLAKKKAFQLLEGTNIYNNSMTFVRELLQNALDATKIQFWRDLRTRYDYRRRLSPDATKAVLENPQNLQPYDIPPDLYENYPVEILVRNITSPCEDGTQTSDETAEILFIDHGTGFTVDTVKRMCRVTESYSGLEFVRELDNMPKWLRPTGGFGIGLQSVFNMADTIFVETQSEQEPPMSIEIDSPQKGGTVRVEIHEVKAEISKDNMEQYPDGRGTVMRIRLKGKPKEVFDTNLLQPCVTHYDKQLYDQIAFLIKSYCSSPLFPITVKWNNECCTPKGKNFHQLFLEEMPGYDNLKHREYYCYRLSKDGTQIEIWDMEGAWLAHWELAHARYLASIMFKGMNIQNVPPLANNLYALCSMDAYGLDVNRHLQLDRDSLTAEGKRVFETAIQKTAKLYMEILWDKFQKNPNAPKFLMRDNDNSYRLDFWMSTKKEVIVNVHKICLILVE